MPTAYYHRPKNEQDNEWYTPPALLRDLEREFGPLTDPARPGRVDGLIAPWSGRIFCNPPWGRGKILPWLKKGALEMDAGRVELIVWLLPVSTDTAWFHDWARPRSKEIRFLRGRLRFLKPDGSVGKEPSMAHMLVIWRKGE